MQRRSQGSNNLVPFTDIKALERTIKRTRTRTMTNNPPIEGGDIGQASRETPAAGSNPDQVPDITGEDVGPVEEARPTPGSPDRANRIPHRAREREYEEAYQRIGEFDEPGTRRAATGIPVPRIPNANFQMNYGLIQAAQDNKFGGYDGENPLDHLDMFDRLCALYKMNGVPTDSLKMMIFPFSLGGQAARWEREVPSNFVTTWEEVRKEFLNMFFPKQKTAKIRASISGFRQKEKENFHDAWSRFQGYIRSCPHHGFGRDAILGIFYRGCNSRYRELLDSSSGGNFADYSVIEGESLIGKMARSGRHGGDDEHDRERTSLQDARVDGVTNKFDKVGISQPRNRDVRFVDEEQNFDFEDEHVEVYYVDNRQGNNYRPPYNNGYNARTDLGGTSNWRPNNQGPYQPPRPQYQGSYQPPRPQNQGYPRPAANYPNSPNPSQGKRTESSDSEGIAEIKRMIQTVIDTQIADRDDINARVENVITNFEGKIDALSGRFNGLQSHVRNLEKELVAATPGTSKPEEKRNWSEKGKSVQREFGQFIDSDDDSDFDYNSEEPIVKEPGLIADSLVEGWMQADAYNKVTATLNTLNASTETTRLKCVDPTFRQHCERLENCKTLFEAIPGLVDSCRPHPILISPKEVDTHPQTNLDESKVVMVDEGITLDPDIAEAEVITTREPVKRPDPGVFTVPCLIKGIPFEKCVLDLGASKSIMPMHACQKVRIRHVDATNTTMVLANWSTIQPVGLARDIPVVLTGMTVPTDFLVVDTGERSSKIILGRPFLASVGAVINVRNKTVEFDAWNNPNKISIRKSGSQCQGDKELTIEFLRTIASEVTDHEYILGATSDRSWDGAGPSRNPLGLSEIEESDSDGEGNSPSDHELDPGDVPSTTPGNAPPS